MKRILVTLCAIFADVLIAQAVTMNWFVDDQLYTQTTCTAGDTVTPPTPPTKHGYTFQEWFGYTPVEYLQSTGRQAFSVGSVFSNCFQAKIVLDIAFTSSSGWRIVGGSPYANNNINIGINSSNRFTFSWGLSNNMVTSSETASNSTRRYLYTLDISNRTFTVRDVLTDELVVNMTFTPQSTNITSGFTLFGYKNSAGAWQQMPCKIYSAKLYNDGVLVRDLVPIIDTDGTPCMYDKVNKSCYYNEWDGGNFIPGSVVNE